MGLHPWWRRLDMKVWMKALERGVLDPEEANKVLKGYKAGVDLPFAGW